MFLPRLIYNINKMNSSAISYAKRGLQNALCKTRFMQNAVYCKNVAVKNAVVKKASKANLIGNLKLVQAKPITFSAFRYIRLWTPRTRLVIGSLSLGDMDNFSTIIRVFLINRG